MYTLAAVSWKIARFSSSVSPTAFAIRLKQLYNVRYETDSLSGGKLDSNMHPEEHVYHFLVRTTDTKNNELKEHAQSPRQKNVTFITHGPGQMRRWQLGTAAALRLPAPRYRPGWLACPTPGHLNLAEELSQRGFSTVEQVWGSFELSRPRAQATIAKKLSQGGGTLRQGPL